MTQAFAANAFFTAGQVIFEVPTGDVADTWGRRLSYLLGAGTLLGATLLYLLMWRIEGPFWRLGALVRRARARLHLLLRGDRGVARPTASGPPGGAATSRRPSPAGRSPAGGAGMLTGLWGYPASYVVSAGVEVLAMPFLLLARRERAPSDPVPAGDGGREVEPAGKG